ncbi:hypothetical protein C8Q80DRAFT_1272351 [Daedaleopsis nitida]|nr:hypothetical protein C8Q80DRAFT_1272351 [Daedaleopsis nitida]
MWQLVEDRERIVRKNKQLWEETIESWFTRTAIRLPTRELCAVVANNNKFLEELAVISNKQKASVGELKSIMKLAELYTTTIGSSSAEPGVPMEKVCESFKKFEAIWIECVHITERSREMQGPLDTNRAILETTRARV